MSTSSPEPTPCLEAQSIYYRTRLHVHDANEIAYCEILVQPPHMVQCGKTLEWPLAFEVVGRFNRGLECNLKIGLWDASAPRGQEAKMDCIPGGDGENDGYLRLKGENTSETAPGDGRECVVVGTWPTLRIDEPGDFQLHIHGHIRVSSNDECDESEPCGGRYSVSVVSRNVSVKKKPFAVVQTKSELIYSSTLSGLCSHESRGTDWRVPD